MRRAHVLLFQLEGPMQSWGYRSRFDYRDTALEPTRSGVIGLICAAMGIARGEDITRFDVIRMGVRVRTDAEGRPREGRPERDYHTALDVIRANGSGVETVVSRRDYIADASFTVGLESENRDLLEEIATALRNPEWILFLGRKAFPLTVPPLCPSDCVQVGTLEEHLLSAGQFNERVVLEAPDGERSQHDWPICFGERQFMPRFIRTCFVNKGNLQ